MSTKVARALIVITTGVLLFVLSLSDHWPTGLLMGVSGLLWFVNTFAHRHFWSSFAFLLVLSGSALLVLWNVNQWVGLFTVLAALTAWDLDAFSRRLTFFDKTEGEIESAHLRRTGLVGVAGFALGSLPLAWHFSLGLGWALLVALILISTLIVTLRWGGRAAG